MNILYIFCTQDRQIFQTKNYQECKSSVNFTLLIFIRFSFPHKFSFCIFIKFSSYPLVEINFPFLFSISTYVPAIAKHTNSLTRETRDVWKTPAFLIQYMRFRQFENYA